jgi:salicylate hydroxylase
MLTSQAKYAKSKGKRKEAQELAAGIEPVWCGTIAYRALIPADKLRAVAPGHPSLKLPNQVHISGLLHK